MISYALSLLKLPEILRLIRVKQWVKNLFLFIPLFFAGKLFDVNALASLFAGFVAFSLVASAVYILNDYNDIERDRAHPEKRSRPLASGSIGVGFAFTLMFIILTAGLTLGWLLDPIFFVTLAIYLTVNLAYSFGLKQIALLDLFIIALGFILRIVGGGLLASVAITQWLVIMVFLLALFLALAKRRDDLMIFQVSGQKVRKSVENYNIQFLDSCLTLISAIIMVSYLMYTISPDVAERHGSSNLYITAVFVIAGMMRYLQITMVENKSGYPTRILFNDTFIRFTIIGWIICFYVVLYFPKF
ncbi:UbiA prenyltransferase [Flammeovirgaceae bacterium 311]|nr:UbiA prenyltransferase [Flammeovirgaceae bacterium 311]